MRLLLIEDSKRLQQSLGAGLRKSGYALDVSGDGEEGLWMAESQEYDAIILDLMLPKMDGLSVLRRLREKGRGDHVLILTARDAVEDRVAGLRAGADDYLVKPFAFEELLARVQALVRRRYRTKSPVLRAGDLVIDTSSREVRRGDERIDLAPRDYSLLELLARRQGQVVSRSEIEGHIYDARVEPMSDVVDSAVCALRRKIDAPGEPSLIRTRRGMGYMISEEARCDPSAAA